MAERISFDRPTHFTAPAAADYIIRDPERILEGWERVYTVVSVMRDTTSQAKIRVGTGGEDAPKWHEEEPTATAGVYYNTEREYHCRRHDRGLVGVYGCAEGEKIIVVWHGYDRKVE